MAKKAKKEKKEKKAKRSRKERYVEPEFPYPGSDRAKDFLVRALIILCCVALGLMIYSIHYFRYVDRTGKREAEERAAKAAAEKPAVGTIWFTQPDGTIVRGDGTPAPQFPSGQQKLPSASAPQLPSAPQELPADAQEPAAGEAPAQPQEPAEPGAEPVTPVEPPQPADTQPYV